MSYCPIVKRCLQSFAWLLHYLHIDIGYYLNLLGFHRKYIFFLDCIKFNNFLLILFFFFLALVKEHFFCAIGKVILIMEFVLCNGFNSLMVSFSQFLFICTHRCILHLGWYHWINRLKQRNLNSSFYYFFCICRMSLYAMLFNFLTLLCCFLIWSVL